MVQMVNIKEYIEMSILFFFAKHRKTQWTATNPTTKEQSFQAHLRLLQVFHIYRTL